MRTDAGTREERSLEKLVGLFDRSEAVTKYGKAVEEISALRTRLAAQERRHKETVASLQDILKRVQEEAARYKALKIEFDGEQVTLEEFERRMLEQTQKVYGEEIQRKVEAILRTEASWPQWFADSVARKVKTGIDGGLDALFQARVQAAITYAKRTEWPGFLEKYNRERLTPFCQSRLSDQLTRLASVTVTKACDRCQTIGAWNLTSDGIASLLTHPYILAECDNPRCTDFFGGRHRIRLSLAEVIEQIVCSPAMPSTVQYRLTGKPAPESQKRWVVYRPPPHQ